MNLSEHYLKAAELLEQTSVIGGKFSRSDNAGKIIGYCVLGALGEAALALGRPFYYGSAAAALHGFLNIKPSDDNYNQGWGLTGSLAGQLAAWSNNLADAGRGSEVIAGLRKAAELAQEDK